MHTNGLKTDAYNIIIIILHVIVIMYLHNLNDPVLPRDHSEQVSLVYNMPSNNGDHRFQLHKNLFEP